VLKFAEREEDVGTVQNADGFYVSLLADEMLPVLQRKHDRAYGRFLGPLHDSVSTLLLQLSCYHRGAHAIVLLQVRRLGATLLRNVNVVDTPGTNVILERQQRLTEEYVPRADLVLFVVSADRPFTESEVEFLQYIR
jgi:Dynamin family